MDYRQQLQFEITMLEGDLEREKRPASRALIQQKLRTKREQLEELNRARNAPPPPPPNQH